MPAGRSAAAGRELLAALDAMRSLDSALGLWTERTLELKEAWETGLPAEAHGVLTGNPDADQPREQACEQGPLPVQDLC
ncbi:hypothetical protein GCM10027074_37350 [Streptomyces deserti]